LAHVLANVATGVSPMSLPGRLLIWGAGGHAKVVADVARASEWEIVAFLDDDPSKQGQLFYGAPVRGAQTLTPSPGGRGEPECSVFVAIGNNAARERCLVQVLASGRTSPVLVDPSARVSPTAVLGPGTIVMAGAVVQADSRIGLGGIVNTGASVDHDCILGTCVHIAPGARLTGQVRVGDRTLIGAGAVVIPQVRIGADNTIGAGAAVVKDTPDGVTLVGVPARRLGT
jgi:sugar O-acyltransferase (sialic acid O-acetyltransferase NeuD family)